MREGGGEGRQLILKNTPLNKIKAAQSATSLQDHLSEQLRVSQGEATVTFAATFAPSFVNDVWHSQQPVFSALLILLM